MTAAGDEGRDTGGAPGEESRRAQLVARAVGKDDSALEELLRLAQPDLAARVSIHPRWRRSLTVEDVLQVSYLEAFLRIGSLRGDGWRSFLAWIRRIVDNNLRDAIRGLDREKRRGLVARETVGERGESARTLLARVAEKAATAGARVELVEDVERLRGAIEKLPPTYRSVVVALDLEERDPGEVSAELGRSRGAVHLLRSRAHGRLAELLRR